MTVRDLEERYRATGLPRPGLRDSKLQRVAPRKTSRRGTSSFVAPRDHRDLNCRFDLQFASRRVRYRAAGHLPSSRRETTAIRTAGLGTQDVAPRHASRRGKRTLRGAVR
ncbi:translocon at the inner envelope membrane ofchloroplasts 20-IV [Striga asiatica]|uniref:Translocon at the inner envelope membrane ofchloroplasts 20-IV n=1 Tax=Striga asiatica TaxID=4170 RepID=A0A5A7PAX3_STRAF|nr:translocon at the inner envelope membrane ofchloroplasts 20-IV [Striga asiatica]